MPFRVSVLRPHTYTLSARTVKERQVFKDLKIGIAVLAYFILVTLLLGLISYCGVKL